jgi:hypothetical protein
VKSCTNCKAVKSLDEFHRQTAARDGRASWCKLCANAITRAGRKRTYTPENKRKWALKTRYGLTPADVESMKNRQGGACGICAKPLARFHIDHDHATNRVRGLLCHRCNILIGGWDDKAWAEAAARWIGRRIDAQLRGQP